MTLFQIIVAVNVSLKKALKLIDECEEVADIKENKTISIIKQVENCKPFLASSIFFVSVSAILTGILIYFYVKLRNRDVLPH